MDTIDDLGLIYRLRPAAMPGAAPLVLLLHGLGSNEDDLFSLAPLLDPRFCIVSARAPHVLGPGAYAWFSILFGFDGMRVDVDEARRSSNKVIAFVGDLIERYPIDAKRVYLMGFSQGAMIAASVALSRPTLASGAILMSGAVLPEFMEHAASADELAGFPILALHGRWDTVVPIAVARNSKQLLKALPVELEYQEFDMDHEISNESFHTVVEWLHERLRAAKASY